MNTKQIQKRKRNLSNRFTNQFSSQSQSCFLLLESVDPSLADTTLTLYHRRNRDTIAEREKELDPEVVEAKRAAEIEKQKAQSKNLVADSIVRELAESTFSLLSISSIWTFGVWLTQKLTQFRLNRGNSSSST